MKRAFQVVGWLMVLAIMWPRAAFAMHIMEGFLPLRWCLVWAVPTAVMVIMGLGSINRQLKDNPRLKMVLALSAAYAFVMSALKIPSVTGSCSHPTGMGLGAVLFGPAAMAVVGIIVLLFQALLLAHGGLTTLGANGFSMAVMGPVVSYGLYKMLDKAKASKGVSVFVSAFAGSLATYVVTSLQLALAFPAEVGGVAASFAKFAGIFAVTQLPLSAVEGLLTVYVFNFLMEYNQQELSDLNLLELPIKSA